MNSLIHDFIRQHKSYYGDEILRAPGRINTIKEARMSVVVAWSIAGLLEFSEVVEGEDNNGGGELGHGDDASKPLNKMVCRLELALEVCGIETVGRMGEPQPANHLSIGACNVIEQILYALRRIPCYDGRVGGGSVEGGGELGKVCMG